MRPNPTCAAGGGHGQFVALLPYLEQRPLYDTYNFDHMVHHPANYTILGVGLNVLFCPSDPEIADLESEYVLNNDPLAAKIRYTSYAGNIGTWNVEPWKHAPDERNAAPTARSTASSSRSAPSRKRR